MSIFKGFFSSTRHPKADAQEVDSNSVPGPETLPVKMNLEERMAFRRELLFEAVRTTLSSNFIEANRYRFKVMRTDKRGHCYVVTFDMPPRFMESEQGQHRQLAAIAAELTKNAQTRYGLVVVGVYWRIDEALAATSAEWVRPTASAGLAASPREMTSRNIEKYAHAKAEEFASFEAAWQKSSPVQIGGRTYSSELAALGEDAPRG